MSYKYMKWLRHSFNELTNKLKEFSNFGTTQKIEGDNYAKWLYKSIVDINVLINQVIDQLTTERLWSINNGQFILDIKTLKVIAIITNKLDCNEIIHKLDPNGVVNKIYLTNRILKYSQLIEGDWRLLEDERKDEYASIILQITNQQLNDVEIIELDLLANDDISIDNELDCITLSNNFIQILHNLISRLYHLNSSIVSFSNPNNNLLDIIANPNIQEFYKNIDYSRCRLPIIDKSLFTDSNQGIWELIGLDEDLLNKQGVHARDPRKDLRLESNIGIDFGTSSTVVAYEDANGRPQLLRIGVDNFDEAVLPEHYENPTVLEFLNIPKMLEHWNEIAQQPLVNWGEVRCSHEALHNLRNNNGDPQIVGSILNNLKQWALREAINDPVRIVDQINGFEYQLAPLELKNPVKGQPLQVKQDDPLDPIELYAWFLGLYINWRQNGLFLKYYMTFPVSYPILVKEKILASFRRGLLRSLPMALIEDQDIISQFFVEERGSEPAAYVASSIKVHDIPASNEGTAYAVFDFGGGTTDFDFGYYRWSTDDEYNNYGIEEILEHFGASGDRFLGGENLLENMAYMVFKYNLDLCQQNKIVFTKPLDAELFPGSEILVDDTHTARTNTLILISKLRPIWEEGIVNNTGIERVVLINRSGEKVTCELLIPIESLFSYLNQRILKGLRNFFSAMKRAFQGKRANCIHILLAGNASKSKRLQILFDAIMHPMVNKPNIEIDDEDIMQHYAIIEQYLTDYDFEICSTLLSSIFGPNIPHFKIHKPLQADPFDSSIPTAKTGVALGLLRICPGAGVKAINHTIEENDGEAPFSYTVGRLRRGKFQTSIMRNSPYEQWQELGIVPKEGIFTFYFTHSNLAFKNNVKIDDSELYPRRVTFPASYAGQNVYAAAITPTSIKIGCSEKNENISEEDLNAVEEVSLLLDRS